MKLLNERFRRSSLYFGIEKVHKEENIVDPLTKPLSQKKHDSHVFSYGLKNNIIGCSHMNESLYIYLSHCVLIYAIIIWQFIILYNVYLMIKSLE